jgi:hypothetical protein
MTVRELMEELGECSLDSTVTVARVNNNIPSKLENLGEVEQLCEAWTPEPGEPGQVILYGQVTLFVKGDEL